MPVLESTDHVSPRSALRIRSVDETTKRSMVTTAAHPVVQRASRARPRPADDDLISEWKRGDEDEWDTSPELRRITNPPQQAPQPQRTAETSRPPQRVTATQPPLERQSRLQAHPLLFLGLGMLAMLILWQLLTASLNWWNNTMDYIHYGYPRTTQVDAVVGHNDSVSNPSHFIATNLHGHIEIVEFPGGDGSHSHTYPGPQLFGSDADTAHVTLEFADVNHDHQPDMLAFFQSTWIVFMNAQGSFRAPTTQERMDAIQYINTHGQP